jgi:hypothetical protein
MVLAEVTHQDDTDGPGVLLLDDALARLNVTTAADRWLDGVRVTRGVMPLSRVVIFVPL